MINLYIDIEGTIIDDLEKCYFIENYCCSLYNFINTCHTKVETNIFTWGWLSKKDIDLQIISNIEKKLSVKINKILVKEDSIIAYLNSRRIHCEKINKSYLKTFEMSMFDENYSKEQSFVDMFSESNQHFVLIDDTIRKSKHIEIFDSNSKLDLININKLDEFSKRIINDI